MLTNAMWLKSFVPFHTKKPIITREISQQSHYLIDFTEGGREREKKEKDDPHFEF